MLKSSFLYVYNDDYPVFYSEGRLILIQSGREMWALYDSFKRSYYNFRYIYDDYPNPIFIVSKKTDYKIHYSNNEADQFYLRIRKIKKPFEKILFRPRSKSRRDL